MGKEEPIVPTVLIGVDELEHVATLAPPALVVPRNARVQFRLVDGLEAKATLTFPAESGLEVEVLPDRLVPVQVTHSGVYYAVVARPEYDKYGAMAVIIIDP